MSVAGGRDDAGDHAKSLARGEQRIKTCAGGRTADNVTDGLGSSITLLDAGHADTGRRLEIGQLVVDGRKVIASSPLPAFPSIT